MVFQHPNNLHTNQARVNQIFFLILSIQILYNESADFLLYHPEFKFLYPEHSISNICHIFLIQNHHIDIFLHNQDSVYVFKLF